jgi:hypothetical protein
MNSIGGYFELELNKGVEYYRDAIRLNTGRNALELILLTKKYSKVYIPYYSCDVILEPFNKTGVGYEFYSIDKNFEPDFNYSKIKENEGFLYINYFGLKDTFIPSLLKLLKNLIVDNSQSFFSLPLKGIPTFYSCRKFFGVPDGAYLYLDGFTENALPLDHSENRFAHLLNRFEYGAKKGYKDFKLNENALIGQSIKRMSNITKSILCNIDYNFIKRRRVENYNYLRERLNKFNKLEMNLEEQMIPMVYPLLFRNNGLKQKLIENEIFVATYWPNVLEWVDKKSIEYNYTTNLIHLPIDQRYGKMELDKMIDLII